MEGRRRILMEILAVGPGWVSKPAAADYFMQEVADELEKISI